jgi:uncharacterized membrane protein YhhN
VQRLLQTWVPAGVLDKFAANLDALCANFPEDNFVVGFVAFLVAH